MQGLRPMVEFAVFTILLLMSTAAVAVTLERLRFYRRIEARAYTSRARLESDLTRRLNLISTVASNSPYIGLLGTVLGIMLTFEALGTTGEMDVKSIMTGLALALKATAAGITVAIPCVAMNNVLRRRVRERLTDFDEAHGG